MRKYNEIPRHGFTTKWYFNEPGKKAIDTIRELRENPDININYVQVDEDVELDAKEVEGSYNIDAFIEKYEEIKSNGTDLSYKLVITYNELNLLVDLQETSSIVVLSTPEPTLEIDDLIQKKNKTLGI